jgi:hypothetical protein
MPSCSVHRTTFVYTFKLTQRKYQTPVLDSTWNLNSGVIECLKIDKIPLRLASIRSRISVLTIVILRGPHMVKIPTHKSNLTCAGIYTQNLLKISSYMFWAFNGFFLRSSAFQIVSSMQHSHTIAHVVSAHTTISSLYPYLCFDMAPR